MKLPKTVNRYCKHCRAKTEHEIKLVSKGVRGVLKAGQRRSERIKAGHGDRGHYIKKPSAERKRASKVVKKQDIRYKCKKCGKQSVQRRGKRAKTIEFVTGKEKLK